MMNDFYSIINVTCLCLQVLTYWECMVRPITINEIIDWENGMYMDKALLATYPKDNQQLGHRATSSSGQSAHFQMDGAIA